MVLIVDGDPCFLEQAAEILGPKDVWFAATTDHARTLLTTVGESVSAILVDVDLPQDDGLRFICELRGVCPDLPVIATTAGSPSVVLEGAKMVGVCETLRKPITSGWRDAIARARSSRAA
jgi:CheY-like chemotaxis protein